MNRLKAVIAIFTLFYLPSCKSESICPYQTLTFNHQKSTVNTTDELKIRADVGSHLDAYLKKIGKGGIDQDLKSKFDKIKEQIVTSEITYDEKYVQNYNLMASAICGELALLKENFTDSFKRVIENDILRRATTFSESLIENKNAKTSTSTEQTRPEKNSERSAPSIEISFLLEKNTRGFKSIFANKKPALILSESTPFNPRILLQSDPEKPTSILIVTLNGDSCRFSRIFNGKTVLPIIMSSTCES